MAWSSSRPSPMPPLGHRSPTPRHPPSACSVMLKEKGSTLGTSSARSASSRCRRVCGRPTSTLVQTSRQTGRDVRCTAFLNEDPDGMPMANADGSGAGYEGTDRNPSRRDPSPSAQSRCRRSAVGMLRDVWRKQRCSARGSTGLSLLPVTRSTSSHARATAP